MNLHHYPDEKCENTKMKKSRGHDLVWFVQKVPVVQKGPEEILSRDEEVCCTNCTFTCSCEGEGHISTVNM